MSALDKSDKMQASLYGQQEEIIFLSTSLTNCPHPQHRFKLDKSVLTNCWRSSYSSIRNESNQVPNILDNDVKRQRSNHLNAAIKIKLRGFQLRENQGLVIMQNSSDSNQDREVGATDFFCSEFLLVYFLFPLHWDHFGPLKYFIRRRYKSFS